MFLVLMDLSTGTFCKGNNQENVGKARNSDSNVLSDIPELDPKEAKYSATARSFDIIEQGSTRNKPWLIILALTVKITAPHNIVATGVAESVDYMNRLGALNG